MAEPTLPEHAVGPDRARWVRRVRLLLKDMDRESAFLVDLANDLQANGTLAVITPAERERVDRIERGVKNE